MRVTLTDREIITLVDAVHDLADEYEQIFGACGWDSEDVAARRKQYDEMLEVARKLQEKIMRKKRKEGFA